MTEISSRRVTLSFSRQTLEVLYPRVLADDIRALFAHSLADDAAAGHSIEVVAEPSGRYSLSTDGELVAEGLDRAALLDCLQDEGVRALIVDVADAVILHAGMVVSGNRAILLPGPTGSGKSSLTAWLVARGFDYCSDEIAALGDGAALIGLPRAMSLKGRAATAALELTGFQPRATLDSQAGIMAAIASARRSPDGHCECGLIVFPSFEPEAELRIAAIAPAQAGLRLMGCNLNARNLPDEGFGDVVALARTTPAISLTYGSFDQLEGVFDVFARLLLDRERGPAEARRFVSAFAEPVVPPRSAQPPAPTFEVPAPTVSRPPRKLTIGMATYDDYDGVYFSLQAIRLFHPEVLEHTNFLLIDNHPDGPCSAPLKRLENHIPNYRYEPEASRSGTAIRNLVFEKADSEFVLCMDCHVFVVPGALKRLLDHFDAGPLTPDLLQGPLLFDDLHSVASHFHPVWRSGMFGHWENDPRADETDGPAFDIPMQGLGLFACRRAVWPGFNPAFRGFGGEEGYIHEKFRQAGGRTLCLPFLRWMHRFERPLGTPYPNRWADRIRNYLIGFREVGWPTEPIVEHFRSHLGQEAADRVIEEVELEIAEELELARAAAAADPASAATARA